jgi:antitoxin component of RelBE/YafQ-DinJ toxin-antitoxin module
MSDQQQNDAASADSTVQVRTERETRDTAAQAILDGEIDQETGEHDDEVLEELEIDEDDVIESLQLRVIALESILRRILAEPQLLACGDKAFCNELATLLDQTN